MSPAGRAQCSGTPPPPPPANSDGTKLDGVTDCLSTGVVWKGARKKKGSPTEAPENAKVAPSAVRGLGPVPSPPPDLRVHRKHTKEAGESQRSQPSPSAAPRERLKRRAIPAALHILNHYYYYHHFLFIYYLPLRTPQSSSLRYPAAAEGNLGIRLLLIPINSGTHYLLYSINIFKSPLKNLLVTFLTFIIYSCFFFPVFL